ncbi:hypothetical protein D3C80_2174510 [compost metagenome]
MVEMILDGTFPFSGYNDDILDAGGNRFFHDVLDRGFVDDGQHFLGHGFGRRQETRSQTGSRNNGFSDFFHYGSSL